MTSGVSSKIFRGFSTIDQENKYFLLKQSAEGWPKYNEATHKDGVRTRTNLLTFPAITGARKIKGKRDEGVVLDESRESWPNSRSGSEIAILYWA